MPFKREDVGTGEGIAIAMICGMKNSRYESLILNGMMLDSGQDLLGASMGPVFWWMNAK
jgi:hypothetical protein